MTTVFHAWPFGRFIDTEQLQEKKNFTERIKAPVLATEIMKESQSNLEEKVDPSILKDEFSSLK